jgi:hypothetical protein
MGTINSIDVVRGKMKYKTIRFKIPIPKIAQKTLLAAMYPLAYLLVPTAYILRIYWNKQKDSFNKRKALKVINKSLSVKDNLIIWRRCWKNL